MRPHLLRDLPISRVLFLLGRQGRAVEIEKFGSEQADPFRTIPRCQFCVIRDFDVGGKHDMPAITRGRFGFAQSGERFGHQHLLMLQLSVMPERLLRRVENEQAVVTVEQNVLTSLEFLGDIMQSDYRWNSERSSHDGGVRCSAPEVCGQTKHVTPVHRRGIGRGQVVRHQNVSLGDAMKFFLSFPLQISNDATRHILDVERAFAQVGIVDLA